MEQTLINASIGIGTLLILIIPLYILSKNSSKQKKVNLLNRFDTYCSENGIQVSEKDIIGNKVFGYDAGKNTMVMVFVMGDVEEEYLIDLDKSSKATANKTESKNGGSEIRLAYSSGSGPKNEILFYRHFRDNEDDLIPLYNKAESVSTMINQIKL